MYLHVPAEFMAYSVMKPQDLEAIFSPRTKRKVEVDPIYQPPGKKSKQQNLNGYVSLDETAPHGMKSRITQSKIENLFTQLFPCIEKHQP